MSPAGVVVLTLFAAAILGPGLAVGYVARRLALRRLSRRSALVLGIAAMAITLPIMYVLIGRLFIVPYGMTIVLVEQCGLVDGIRAIQEWHAAGQSFDFALAGSVDFGCPLGQLGR